MRIDIITPAAGSPLSPAEAKAVARVNQASEDGLFERWVLSATRTAEELCDRQCLVAEFELVLDGFCDPSRIRPTPGRIELRPAPLVEVLSVKYIDSAGVEQTLDPALYLVSIPKGDACAAGAVILAPGKTWPTIQTERLESVRIRFKAGYGTEATAVPSRLKDAIAAGVGELNQGRDQAHVADVVAANLDGDLRLWR